MVTSPTPTLSWNLTSPRDLLNKAKRELTRFQIAHEAGSPDQVDHAMNCALSAWHIHDWVWKIQEDQWKGKGFSTQRQFRDWLFAQCTDKTLVFCNEIADGSKHLILDRTVEIVTSVSAADVPDSMNKRMVEETLETGKPAVASLALTDARAVLKIERLNGQKIRVNDIFEGVLAFWEKFFAEYNF